jgi:starch phosphorylase
MNTPPGKPIRRWSRGERGGRIAGSVHFSSWMSSHVVAALSAQLGPDWADHADRPGFWESLLRVDEGALWRAHLELKTTLLRVMRDDARNRWTRHGAAARSLAAGGILLDPAVLTLGFVRRFTSYKRAPILFRDLDRLERLLVNWRMPVQVVFGGQPHPADEQLLHPRFGGRIAFVHDTNGAPMRCLVQGVDVWINIPRAHGTVDMTAALNAVPELSTRDGWWAEGYGELNGWEIPDSRDVTALYTVLETRIAPLFYQRDDNGMPGAWVEKMKHALRLADPRLTAQRMVRQHVTRHYAEQDDVVPV